MHLKQRIFEIIQQGNEGDRASKLFDVFIILLICLNVTLLIVDTFNIPKELKKIFHIIETISVIIFTVEYALRIWTSNLLYPAYSKPKALLKYIFSFMAIIDLLAILPFYLPIVISTDLRVLRLLRILRLFRLFKLNRYTSAFETIAEVLKSKSNELLSSIFVVGLLILISSVIMYNIENAVQPDVFQNAFSGLWWSVAAFTTVGYGDIVPITIAGQILSIFISVLGIGMVAVPTGIISAGFIEHLEKEKEPSKFKNKVFCAYCGNKLDN